MKDSAISYNLIDKPWICVRMCSGESETLSISDVFCRADTIAMLSNEIPTQDFAILRLLIAILLRSVQPMMEEFSEDDELYPSDMWGELWDAGMLPLDDVLEYLKTWHHRFDLLDPLCPFMQVAGMHSAKNEVLGVRKIIADVPDGLTLFSLRSGRSLDSISMAEAARWLVHVHAFDTSGIKTGVAGDPNVKGGKSYPIGTGWAGSLGGIYLEGKTLAQTLVLNLVLCDNCHNNLDDFLDYDVDLPAWERPQKTPGDDARQPEGYADLYTWQSRRTLLFSNNNRVTGVLLSNGDKLEPRNKEHFEPMTAWRRSTAQEKKLKSAHPIFLPRTYQSAQALWRGITSLLPTTTSGSGEGVMVPGVTIWAGHLASLNGGCKLSEDFSLRMHATGCIYGTQNSVITEMIDDTLDLNAFLLSSQGAAMVDVVRQCMAETDQAVRELGFFARNIKVAAGMDPELVGGIRESAKAEAYYELDVPFRMWLGGLGSNSSCQAERESWRQQAYRIVGFLAREMAEHVSTEALTGRNMAVRNREEWLSFGTAEARFWRGLRKALSIDEEVDNETK